MVLVIEAMPKSSKEFQGTRTVRVPRSRTCTIMVFMGCSLGILGDNLPINTHVI